MIKQNLLKIVVSVLSLISLNSEAKPAKPNKPPIATMQVNYADATNLFKVVISALGSQDIDGSIVKTEINLGDGSPKKVYDGNFVKKNQSLAYTYQAKGRYTVMMIHTDNKGMTQSTSKVVDVLNVASLVNKGIIFGPEKYKESSNTYVRNISRTAEQTQDFYKITLKNADGLEHAEKNCSGLSAIKKIKCKYDNAKEAVYRRTKRAHSVVFTLNNEPLFWSNEFNSDTAQIVKFVRLVQQNQFRLRVIGGSSASVEMAIEQFSALTTGGDTTAPVLSSNVGSNTLTNKSTIHISIADQSAVATQVFKNGTLVGTQQVKEFDLALTEGANSFVLKAMDASNNKAADFTLNNITLDTQAPVLVSNVSSNSTVTSSQVHITVTDSASVTTQVYKNGALIATQQSKSFDLTLTPGSNSFTLKAVDVAQNAAADFVLSNITFQAPDTVAPKLASNVTSGTLTNNNKISIVITDQSSVTTQVYRGEVLIATEQNKSFNLTLEEGVNNFTLKATDAAQNKAVDFVLSNITLDTVKPNILSDLKSQYLFNSLPKAVTVTMNVNESVKNVTVNGNPAILIGPLSYSYTLQFTQAGTQNYIIKAQDMAGNETSVQQGVTVILDDVAPEITTNSVPAVIAANEFDLNVTVTDSLSVQSEIYLNEQLKQTTTEKSFTYKVVFDPTQHVQTHTVKIISTDAVQNKTVKEITLKKDTTPLMVQITAPVNNSVLSSPVVEVRAVANRPLAVAKINNQVAIIDADQVTVKGTLQQPSDGKFTVTVSVTDVHGAMATAEVQAEVKTLSSPFWTYEECPAK